MWLRFVKPLKWLEAWFRPYKKMLEGVLFDMSVVARIGGGLNGPNGCWPDVRPDDRVKDCLPWLSPLSTAAVNLLAGRPPGRPARSKATERGGRRSSETTRERERERRKTTITGEFSAVLSEERKTKQVQNERREEEIF
ncbi:unnamed protein product [Camellia sinensis]